MPESAMMRVVWGGKLCVVHSRLRVSKHSTRPATPQALANWSINPDETPTYSFSAIWHNFASANLSIFHPEIACQVVAKATSTAAELLSPAPIGTSEVYTACIPPRGHPACCNTQATPAG